jgi:hypoxanthine phosphoribosyltransferase
MSEKVVTLKDKTFELFIKESAIMKEIERLAGLINTDYEDKCPVFVCVLGGAFIFSADLVRKFKYPCEVTFIRLQSYAGVESEGHIKEIQGFVESLENRHVIIVEDIIDTGCTMEHLVEKLKNLNPASVKIAVLLLKPDALKFNIKPEYVALSIPNDFIVGFGLDYNGLGRNLKDIYKIKN